ncbi:iron-siderophore ABC transporter substrate-binding protein [Streptomyces sp. AC555_RSS877]|uniref:ABC transporter substrate-binding protein n=1 Tax=Streptomyces sp. AC555_RSS877 TaxID=2823688 RepID=UPI001C2695B5|nr:iron-siderophore ABC transporter substrate-binding protein [Streptomyces sp. AC555_RSS877]
MHRPLPSSSSSTLPRRRFAAAVAAVPLALLTACAAGSPGPTAVEGGAGSSVSVRTAYGAVEVPAAPRRVVALGDTALDSALALGVEPVGTLASRGGSAVSPYLAGKVPGVALVGTVAETNLEAVAAARPELILAASGTPRERYDALKAIAPTVVPEPTRFGAWESETRSVAAALGKEAEAERLLDGIEQRAEDIAAGRSADGTGTAVVVRWMATGPVILSSALMPGRLLKLTGDRISPAAAFTGKPHTDPLSLENLGEIDADRIYLTTLNADGEKALAAARAQPAFARLRAVRTGNVDVVDGDVWSSAAGPLAAAAMLDDIERLRIAA